MECDLGKVWHFCSWLGRAQPARPTLEPLQHSIFLQCHPSLFLLKLGFARQLQSAGWGRQVPSPSSPTSFFPLGWAPRGVHWFVFTVPAPGRVVGFENFRLSDEVCCGNQGGAGSSQREKVRAGVCTRSSYTHS